MTHSIRLFSKDDIAPALNLCRSAGWNQLQDDWARLIDYQPDGCFVAYADDQIVGTVTATCYGTELAWIGMMLVHPEYRRRGIATELMNRSLRFLRDRHVKCIKLDATPAGQPVYERLGFQPEWNFHRWQLDSPEIQTPQSIAGTLPIGDFQSLDQQAFGTDRLDWLERLAKGSLCHSHSGGFGMMRAGHLADYLGPVIAVDADAAGQIVRQLLSHARGQVFWDIPGPNQSATRIAEQLGFQPIRDLTRMWTGDRASLNMDLQYALCDPGTG